MNYPSIGQYTETIKLAAKAPEDYFDKLSNLRPVFDANGEPIMSSGNFAVVFKVQDIKSGKYYALKCFHREQEKRSEYYQLISEELNKELKYFIYGTQNTSTSYLIHVQYYNKEMYVDMGREDSLFPVLLMEWVDGVALDKYIYQNINNKKQLRSLTYQFSRMAQWMLSQKIAHGDLKPDNILVRHDGTLVLVDYDGMFVPTMKGYKSLELGSPNYRHPQRTVNDFNEHMDDFSIASILLSLKAISLDPSLYIQNATGDKLLFEEQDYQNLSDNRAIVMLRKYLYDKELANLLGVFLILLNCRYFPSNISSLIDVQRFPVEGRGVYSEFEIKEAILHFYKSINIFFPKIVYLIPDLFHSGMRECWLPQNFWVLCNVESIWWSEDTYKSIYRFGVEYDAIRYSVIGEFSKKSRPNLSKLPDGLSCYDYNYLVNYTYDILFEMGVANHFAKNVNLLIKTVNENKQKYNLNREDLPF